MDSRVSEAGTKPTRQRWLHCFDPRPVLLLFAAAVDVRSHERDAFATDRACRTVVRRLRNTDGHAFKEDELVYRAQVGCGHAEGSLT